MTLHSVEEKPLIRWENNTVFNKVKPQGRNNQIINPNVDTERRKVYTVKGREKEKIYVTLVMPDSFVSCRITNSTSLKIKVSYRLKCGSYTYEYGPWNLAPGEYFSSNGENLQVDQMNDIIGWNFHGFLNVSSDFNENLKRKEVYSIKGTF